MKALSDGINLELFAGAVDQQGRGTGREEVRALAFIEAGREEEQHRGLLFGPLILFLDFALLNKQGFPEAAEHPSGEPKRPG